MSLSKPSKHLRYSEAHFEGYWAQLITLIRHNDEADLILDKLLTCPLLQLVSPNMDEDTLITFKECYTNENQPFITKLLIENDPIKAIRVHRMCTTNTEEQAVMEWNAQSENNILKFRKGIRHIYETVVATLSVSEATEILGDLPYGSGIKLLNKVQMKQRRQTSMSLFILFDNILGLRIKPNEKLSALFTRLKQLRRRLSNWTPPISLPDQLILVCILRALPEKYRSTRIIIMASKDIQLDTAEQMLLDAENADAKLIQNTLACSRLRQVSHEWH